MNNILEETRFIINKYNIRANKSLGQNFLINENVVSSIVECSNITKEDLVIEIGPGLGTLTKELLEKAGKVVCIELDTKMLKILNDRFVLYKNLEILNEDVLKKEIFEPFAEEHGVEVVLEVGNNSDDVLKVDLHTLIKEQKEKENLKQAKIVANLPYYITTPIIMKLLEEELDLESITVMIQKEVADRIIAIPGKKNTGAITYSVYYYAEAEAILEVPKDSFIPAPEVTSKVIKLNIRKEPPVKPESKEKMFKTIKNAFTQRRKTLLNSLVNTKMIENKTQGAEILKKLKLNENVRPEELTLENFAEISNNI